MIQKNNTRAEIRKKILLQRDNLAAADRQQKSLQIGERLWQLAAFRQAQTLFVYVNFRSEVETLPIIKRCLVAGKTVAVPLTDSQRKQLLPFLITDPARDLRPGYCAIPEPDPERAEPCAAENIDLVILPGSVFDEQGGRLGYGGGYYDRFLVEKAPAAKRVALAFDLQIVAELPLLPHDQKYDWLISESRTISPQSGQR